MLRKTAIVAGITLALSATAQADYQWELGAGYARGDIDLGLNDDIDADVYAVSGSYFLQSVDTSKGPLSEAAFLDRASGINLNYTNTELSSDYDDADSQGYGAAGRFVAKESGWLVDLAYLRSEPEDFEIDTYSIGAGKYIFENTAVILSYAETDVEDGGDTDGYNVAVEQLWLLSQGGIKVDASYGFVNVDDADDIDVYSLGGTYYINSNLGLGASYSNLDSSGDELEQWSLGAEWFINEQVAVSLAYSESEVDDTDFEIDTVAITIRIRPPGPPAGSPQSGFFTGKSN